MKKQLGCFTDSLHCTKVPEGNKWLVEREFWFIRPNGDAVYCPAGWETDLNSTRCLPPILQAIFPSDGPNDQAAVLHDFLYGAELFPRSVSDQIFKEAMEAIPGMPRWKIGPMWLGVRLGGWATYGEHSAESIKKLRGLINVRVEARPLWKDGQPRYSFA